MNGVKATGPVPKPSGRCRVVNFSWEIFQNYSPKEASGLLGGPLGEWGLPDWGDTGLGRAKKGAQPGVQAPFP
jgi:hypothetical protein